MFPFGSDILHRMPQSWSCPTKPKHLYTIQNTGIKKILVVCKNRIGKVARGRAQKKVQGYVKTPQKINVQWQVCLVLHFL